VRPDARRSIRPPRPLDLRATLAPLTHGRSDLSARWARDGFWRATRTPEGAATLHLVADRQGGVTAEAWGPGSAWACDGLDDLVGTFDDRAGFEPARHRVVEHLDAAHPGLRIGRSRAVMEALVPTIIGQKVTSESARASWRSLVRALGEPAPGPAPLVLPPSPEQLAEAPYTTFHRCNIERRRAETIRGACRRARRLEALVEQGTGDADRVLRSLPGIGQWTAGWVRLIALGDPDAVPVGDYGIPSLVSYTLTGEREADDARLLTLLAPFAGHRGRVVRLVKAGGAKPARRAPRARHRDITTA
jgi:3-methyladenine DNA glycosylase/8-oxoguanine DNA glycosylase